MTRWRTAVALAAAIAGVAVTMSLGNWQSRRAEQKLALQAQWDAVDRAAPEVLTAQNLGAVSVRLPLRVALRGRFLHHRSVWLDNRQQQGRPGFWVVTPMQLDGAGAIVLVNRGWAPRNARERAALAPIGEPAGIVTVEGLALSQLPRLLDLGGEPAPGRLPAIWQNLDFEAFEQASGLRVARLIVQQSSSLDDGLLRQWTRPDAGVDKHRGYALQWYGLAALIGVLTLWLGTRALRRRADAGGDGA